MIVLDTHAFIWYLTDDDRLPASIKTLMQGRPEEVFVPSICLWEMMVLVQKGKLALPKGRPDRLLRKYLSASGFTEVPLSSEIALLSRTLEFGHADPADRFVAATAKPLGFPLATSDAKLRKLEWLRLAY